MQTQPYVFITICVCAVNSEMIVAYCVSHCSFVAWISGIVGMVIGIILVQQANVRIIGNVVEYD